MKDYNKPFVLDDRSVDLSRFEGLSHQDIKEAVAYVERLVFESEERCKNMTKEDQLKEIERSEREIDIWLDNFIKKKLSATA